MADVQQIQQSVASWKGGHEFQSGGPNIHTQDGPMTCTKMINARKRGGEASLRTRAGLSCIYLCRWDLSWHAKHVPKMQRNENRHITLSVCCTVGSRGATSLFIMSPRQLL